jgi:hypothetical protein
MVADRRSPSPSIPLAFNPVIHYCISMQKGRRPQKTVSVKFAHQALDSLYA